MQRIFRTSFLFNESWAVKEGVSLHSQQKVRFREYFEYLQIGKNMKKINQSEGGKEIDFTY